MRWLLPHHKTQTDVSQDIFFRLTVSLLSWIWHDVLPHFALIVSWNLLERNYKLHFLKFSVKCRLELTLTDADGIFTDWSSSGPSGYIRWEIAHCCCYFYYAPINIPPGQPPGHLNFWRLACSNSLPSGQKSRSNAPPISTELSLLKDKFRLQSNTLHAFQREICHNDTFKLLLKTLLKELFTNKGEIPSCKSVKPC